jgi:two-component system sensor histidine kinase/response regulator
VNSDRPAAAFTSDAPPRILIVDDNLAIHEDFRKILASRPAKDDFEDEDAAFFGTPSAAPDRASFDLSFASQGLEALELVAAATREGRRYSVVFMDVRMPPGLDGIETTARLWEIDRDLQVVICTAYSDHSWEEMVGRLGLTDRLLILKKPFDMVEVVQCAHALTGKWSLLQQTRRHAESLESSVRERTAELEEANKRLESEITERRRSEEALRFTQFSVDNAPEAMFWAAPDSRLLYANSATCKALGYSAPELQALGLSDIVPELGGDAWPSFRESLKTARHRTFETNCRAKDGSEIPIEFTAALFTFGGKELLCASARDITLRKRILAELSAARDTALESVRLKGRFLANMSHEIRTPMNGVVGMAELLLHTNLDRDQRDYVDTIRSSADLLLNLINDILDSSKIEAGMLNFETLDFDLGEVVESTLDMVGGVSRNKGLELAGHVHVEVPRYLRGDAGRLRQVLTNILGNAVKFTARGEVVLMVSLLEETETAARLRFEVRDTGIGIAEESRKRIFEPFVQADGSDTRKYGGTGLGLSICRQIVEALGGEIGVDSEPGQGSTFWFNLGFEKQTEPSRRPLRAIDCPADLRILVVDDNATNRKILQLQLSNLLMRPAGVENGEEALDLLLHESSGADPFRLAIIDMQMPGMDGLSLARQIKSKPAIADTRLIILSSLGDQLADSELAAAGVEGHLVKPVKQARLHEALSGLFRREIPLVRTGEPVAPNPDGEQPGTVLPLRILLAEDNPVNQKVALLQLRSIGHEADVASDGAKALEMLSEVPYDVILMDCQMPVLDGWATTREIRRSYPHPVRIIAMTANAMQGDREQCLEAGMDDFLSKPVRAADLARALQMCRPLGSSVGKVPVAQARAVPDAPVDLDRLLEITGRDAEMFRQIMQDYLEQAEEILSSMILAIEGRSAGELRELAHKLCGSSASCGMQAIVPPLRRLEQLGQAGQFDRVDEFYQDAVRQLYRIRRFLIGHLADSPLASPSNS